MGNGKSIEWYDSGIKSLKKLIRQHEIELEQFVNEINSDIDEQKSKVRVEEATGQNKKKILSKEVNDIDFLIKKYEIKLREYTYRMYTKLGKVRKTLIRDLENTKENRKRIKGNERIREITRLGNLKKKREKLKEKLEVKGIKVPVLDIKQIESEIEEQINSEIPHSNVFNISKVDETEYEKKVVSVLNRALDQFLRIAEKPDFITYLTKIMGEDSLLEIVEFLQEIIEKFRDLICPECGQTSLEINKKICELCGYDFTRRLL